MPPVGRSTRPSMPRPVPLKKPKTPPCLAPARQANADHLCASSDNGLYRLSSQNCTSYWLHHYASEPLKHTLCNNLKCKKLLYTHNTHARTRTHARTHTCMHVRMYARTHKQYYSPNNKVHKKADRSLIFILQYLSFIVR